MQQMTQPKCFAHEFGRELLNAIAYSGIAPNEQQKAQMENVEQMRALPVVMQTGILRDVAAKDALMQFMLTRCKSAMPDAHVDPLAVAYARLLVSTEEEAMIVCAMLFALTLDLADGSIVGGTAKHLCLTDLKRFTRNCVMDSEMANLFIEAQGMPLVVEGLDHHKLNHKQSYEIVMEV